MDLIKICRNIMTIKSVCLDGLSIFFIFRPLGYKSLLRFVRCSLANNQGYLAKSEVEYTLNNKDLALEEEEIQQQIHEIINADWYQSAASFDTTYIKLEKYSCFLIFMNQ